MTGRGLKKVEEEREKGTFDFSKMKWDRNKQREERWASISESRYNKWYKRVKGEGISEYLKKGWAESRWGRIARYRMGEGIKEGMYWAGEEERRCRMCGREEETCVGGLWKMGGRESMGGDGEGGIGREREGRRVEEEIGSVQRGRGRWGRVCEEWRGEYGERKVRGLRKIKVNSR